MTRPVIEAFDTPHAAEREAADAIADALREALREKARATFIVTGGRSPGPVYDLLARAGLPWERIAVTLSDERWVDPASPDSNERLVRERLGPPNFVPLKTGHPTPQGDEAALAAILPADVVLLGMGEDGHVASLFPGGPEEGAGLTLPVPDRDPPRLSLTPRALAANRLTVVLVSGQAKRRALEAGGLPVHRLLDLASAPVRILWSP